MIMKKSVILLLVVIFTVVSVFIGSKQVQAEADYLNMSWDEIVEAAKEEGELIYYVYWGEEFWKTAGENFSKKYGIDTKIIIGDHDAIDSKVLAEKNKTVGTIDMSNVSGRSTRTLVESDVLYGPILSVIPNADKMDPKLRRIVEGIEHNGYLVPLYRNQTGLLYDPQKVSNPPQTWDELVAWIKANPKQFAFCDPSKGGTGQAFVQLVLDNLAGGLDRYKGDIELDPAKVENWNIAWDWLNEMQDLMIITGSNAESLTRFNDGEISLTVAWSDEVLMGWRVGTLFKRAKFYIPEMGSAGGGDTAGIMKNAPHKAAAMLMIAYLIEEDVQGQMNEMIGTMVGRTDVKPEKSLVKEEERQKYATEWVPAEYKNHFINEFVKNVLMK
jgi:putative spermidine/putrescine transport system substrate-binding protein